MKKIIIPSHNHLRVVNQLDIIDCQSDNYYTSLYLTTGEELVICKSLTRLLKELDAGYFIRVNQSHIINKDFIKLIDKKNKHIQLINNKLIPFTKTVKELLMLLHTSTD